MKNLDKAAKACGQTRQAFVTGAVLAEVAEVLDRERMKKQRIRPSEQTHEPESTPSSSFSTASLTDALMRRDRPGQPAPSPSPNTQGPVVVNVGAGSAPSGEVERLAAYVMASGNDLEREARLKTAVDILRASASTDEEKRVLAAKLDEAVATKTKTNEGSIARTARVAFDKLAGFFGGDGQ